MNKQVWIIGAGPVGLLLAHLLHQQQITVEIFEKRSHLPNQSMAIGITPPSLAILQQLGLREQFETQGIHIRQANVYENQSLVGTLGFDQAGDHILSLPQTQTLEILRNSLRHLPNVTLHENAPFTLNTPLPSDTLVIGCDGSRSTVRERAGISTQTKSYRAQFVMADFEDIEQAGPNARLFFSHQGSVESFPLPSGCRRWVCQVLPGETPDIPHIIHRVNEASGVDLSGVAHGLHSHFIPTRSLANRFHKGPFILCGDAAHQLSPIGGQGMNTGFADAYQLSAALMSPSPTAINRWARHRKQAFNAAATRAALGMHLGTLTGERSSRMRAMIIRTLLHHSFTSKQLARSYAMLNLPHPIAI
ncbi:NAD(P)/FAD-dependent oxidoreductase [Kiritimatiellota bacterium B12222]|nr:NAD(P)/FAD-dependent oxidoreductase [Kiritimatiellota bacterium B12222]